METQNPIEESKARAKVTYKNLIIAAVVVAAVALLAIPNARKVHPHPKIDIKANLAGLSNGLQKFAEAHDGYYPLRMSELFEWDPTIAPKMLGNQFTKQKMREIGFKESPFAGEYTYIPHVQDGKVCGFYLIAYWTEDFDGEDVDKDGMPDHVLQVLGSDGSSNPDSSPLPNPPQKCILPPLDELLKAQKENLPIEIDDGQKSAGGE